MNVQVNLLPKTGPAQVVATAVAPQSIGAVIPQIPHGRATGQGRLAEEPLDGSAVAAVGEVGTGCADQVERLGLTSWTVKVIRSLGKRRYRGYNQLSVKNLKILRVIEFKRNFLEQE